MLCSTMPDVARVLCHVALTRRTCARADILRELAETALARCQEPMTAAQTTALLHDAGVHK